MTSLRHPALAILITLALSLSTSADGLDLLSVLSDGKVVPTVLSDGLSNESGQWKTKVQLVFDSKSQRIVRLNYQYFDPVPSRDLDIVWYPDDEFADRPGRITGTGRLVWRVRDHAAWDPASIVSIFTGEMRHGRPNGSGEFITIEGLIYSGAWRDGRANGFGRLRMRGGEEYRGSFRDGMADGNGRELEATGEVFEGTFRAGLRNGTGKTKLPSGFSYESSWINGVETVWSRRIRLAQMGGPSGVGGSEDVRIGVMVSQNPTLPHGVAQRDIVTYGSSIDGDKITVQPADKQLMDVWKGNGELQNANFNFNVNYINAVPLTLILSFENHTAQPITIQALRLQVSESNTDNEPAIRMRDLSEGECQAPTFSTDYYLENFGWSPAKGAQMRISFVSPRGLAAPQIAKSIGDLPGRQHIDLGPELAQFHVNVAQLKQLSERGFPCPSGSLPACLASKRFDPLFGTLGPQLDLNGTQIILHAGGYLDYNWTDNKGAAHSRSSPFKVKIGLGRFEEAAECANLPPPQPTAVAAIQLRLDVTNYTLPLPYHASISAGNFARVSLPVAAAKSSDHSFRIVATLADGKEITSLPINLLYFRPQVLPDVP
jgi:hypothetical protein